MEIQAPHVVPIDSKGEWSTPYRQVGMKDLVSVGTSISPWKIWLYPYNLTKMEVQDPHSALTDMDGVGSHSLTEVQQSMSKIFALLGTYFLVLWVEKVSFCWDFFWSSPLSS